MPFLPLVLGSAAANPFLTSDNITVVAETLISIPVEQATPQGQALAHLVSKGESASAAQGGGILQSLGSFLQTLLNDILYRDEPTK